MKRLFLIDGSALVYRAYFAFISKPLINSKGEHTSAPFGFTNTLLKLLREEKPDYLGIVFDTGKPTFRHEKFPEYKATRQRMPDDMRLQVPRVIQVLEAMNLYVTEVEGFEADDVIGTLARQASEQGIHTVMVTGDKDFLQLVSPQATVLNPKRGGEEPELIDEAGVQERLGVPPNRVTDVLALMGDSSDNVPGIPGIGPKSATALIQQFGDLEAALANPSEAKGKRTPGLLEEYADQARLSKELVTIDAHVPVTLDLDALKVGDFATPQAMALFRELEFRRFLEELEALAGGLGKPAEEVAYHTVDEASFPLLLERIREAGKLAIDLETTSLDVLTADLVGISVALTPNEAFYIPVGHTHPPDLAASGAPANLPLCHVLEALKPILESEAIEKYGQNVKYDTAVLLRYGIQPNGFVFDTMVAAYLINPSARQHGLDALSSEYLNHKMIPITDLIGKGKDQKSFAEVPIDTAATYSCEDADITLRLKELFEPRLRDLGLLDLFQQVEMPLVPVLRDMELAGVSVDVAFLNAMSADLQKEMDRLTEEIYESAGEPFNLNSTQQLAAILFDRLGLKPKRKTKTGYSTDVDVLEGLSAQHDLPRKLLEYRELAKLRSTYVDALPRMIHPLTGRIHASFNQTVAATGRLSSSDPNLQNIPIRTPIGRQIRKAFVPKAPGWLLLSADYSQIELRIMAHLSGDATLIEAFQNDEDIHTRTASLIFGLFPQFITPDLRRQAKTINFGIIYGMGPYGLARQLAISVKEARDFIDRYFATYPGVRAYTTRTVEQAKKDGFVTTLMGRRRYLPELASTNAHVVEFGERTAVNTPIQGSAADLIKIAMINACRRISREHLQAKMILQVHDELVFEIPEAEAHATRALVTQEMAHALQLSVPIKVDCGVGANWLEAH